MLAWIVLIWIRVVLKPWWTRALVSAGLCAIVVAANWCARGLTANPDHSWSFTGHVATIVIFGLLVAALTGNARRAYVYAFAGLDPAQQLAAVDASLRGPVPVDARVRDAAIRVGRRRLQSARWLSYFGALPLLPIFLLHRGTSAMQAADWINFAVVLCVTVLAASAWINGQQRLQTLKQTGDFDGKAMV